LLKFVLVVGAATDVIIASSLILYLIFQRLDGPSSVAPLIDRLVGWNIRTGAVTSAAALAMLICFETMPNNLVWLGLYTFLSKLYSTSLLSVLNARQSLRNVMDRNIISELLGALELPTDTSPQTASRSALSIEMVPQPSTPVDDEITYQENKPKNEPLEHVLESTDGTV
jgi:hypothetical protein